MPIPIPNPEDVARVARMNDRAARNREVTRGYYLFSQRFREHLGEELSWPTMAAWASAQAGLTIRKEDLLRLLERRLGDSAAVRRLIDGPFRDAAGCVLREMLKLDPFERSSQAVSRGNIKVYAEIGLDFARFLKLLESAPSSSDAKTFIDSLKPGPPPDGQDILKKAFAAYFRALQMPAGAERSQLIFYANVSVGFHEQTRLQPEIVAAVDGSALDAIEIKDRLLDAMIPLCHGSFWAATQWLLKRRLNPYLAPLVAEIQTGVREIVTENLMVLELLGEVIRLGQDLSGAFPSSLRTISNADALALLAGVDTTPDSIHGSGARDWTSFSERMHFIADLFRSRQADTRLFGPLGGIE